MPSNDFQQQLEHAVELWHVGNHVGTLAILDQLVPAAPQAAALRRFRAQVLMELGDKPEALAEARQAAELDPDDVMVQLVLGQVARFARKLNLAQQALEKAVELSGREPKVLTEYAEFMAFERGPKPGERAALEAVQADRQSATAWTALAVAQHRLHRLQDADASLKRALQLEPNNALAQWVMVSLLREKGEYRQALALAGLLEDTTGSDELTKEIRKEANRRRAFQILVEREEVQKAAFTRPRRWGWIWLAALATMLFVLAVFFRPWTPAGAMCGLAALLFLQYLYYLYRASHG